MRSQDIFPSKYLRASDLNGHEPIVTIERVELQSLGEDHKLVVFFRGKDKGLVLNRTNFAAIEDLTKQEDTDHWTGHKVKLVTAEVSYKGRPVPAIRITDPTGTPNRIKGESWPADARS